jgi:multidrug resistance efflux pump
MRGVQGRLLRGHRADTWHPAGAHGQTAVTQMPLERATVALGTIVARSQLDSADASYKVALSRHEDAVEEVRNRQALLAQRRSELALARQQLADTAIFAPFEGAVQ